MAYNATYTEGDIASASLNVVVKAVITVGTLITLIVIAVLYRWGKKAMKR